MSGGTNQRLLSASDLPVLSLQECSYDSDNKKFLVDCEEKAICCDKVTEHYVARIGGIKSPPKSVDAAFVGADGRCTFVEFKNRALDKRLALETMRKAYDTLLILADLKGICIGETRNDSDLVLVVSSEKTRARNKENHDNRTEVSRSNSFSQFGKTLAKIANDNFIEGGMGTLKGYCFNDVFVFTEREFQEDFMRGRKSLL